MRKFFALSITLISLVGCGGSPSLVGKWNMTGGTLPPGSKFVTEFKDKTYTISVEVEQLGSKIKFDVDGDYTYDGKRLKMVSKAVRLDESTLPAIVKPQASKLKEQIEKNVLTTQEGEATLTGDVLTMMDKGKPATFTRMK